LSCAIIVTDDRLSAAYLLMFKHESMCHLHVAVLARSRSHGALLRLVQQHLARIDLLTALRAGQTLVHEVVVLRLQQQHNNEK
jgi:hypothetical protein